LLLSRTTIVATPIDGAPGLSLAAPRRAPLCDAPIHAIPEKLIVGAEDLPAEVRAGTGDEGADGVFDLAPPLIALLGLLGVVLGEQAIDLVRRPVSPFAQGSIEQPGSDPSGRR
jgi:hypothetical protein